MKPIEWVGSSKKDLKTFPAEVQDEMGYALRDAQYGGRRLNVKPLSGFGGTGVLEVVDDHRGDTYRAVYTVNFGGVVYVLHAFQKKSKSGRGTPKHEMDVIRERYKAAERHYRQYYGKEGR
jgi:phage-related protein